MILVESLNQTKLADMLGDLHASGTRSKRTEEDHFPTGGTFENETGENSMGKVDKINTGNGSEFCVNLSRGVGNGGPNDHWDVLLVQALFKYIAETDFSPDPIISGPGLLGIGDQGDGFVYDIPELTGVMDLKTQSAINQFQVENRPFLLVQWFDGLIEPAKYTGRTLRNLYSAKVLSITYLHVLARMAANKRGDTSYITALKAMDARLSDSFLMETTVDWSSL